MINRLTEFYHQNKHFLFRTKKIIASNGLACITLSPEEILFTHGQLNNNKIQIHCESLSLINASLPDTLVELTGKQDKYAYSLVLQPQDYQLLLLDALPVTPAEFQAAIRWKVKDLIQIPLDDAIIDSFTVPQSKQDKLPKIMVVITSGSYLKNISNQLQTAGVNLKIIDIPELVLRNITALYETENESTALIYALEKNIEILITAEQQVYFNRRLNFGLGKNDGKVDLALATPKLDQLTREIQRSIEYYQSQWRKNPLHRILFASNQIIDTELTNYIASQLNLPVEIMDLNTKITFTDQLTGVQQGRFLTVIGGVLRDINQYA